MASIATMLIGLTQFFIVDRMFKKKSLYLLILILPIAFNLGLFWPELKISSEVNDNVFQFGLIKRANEVWDEANCPLSLRCLPNLIDHWVPYWASGYPLPFYYSHLPQVAIVASYRLLSPLLNQLRLDLFNYFLIIKYLLLCLFPLSLFWAARILGWPRLAAAVAALFSWQILTDGLYGIDISSFLWRGYGLSSQLFSVFFAPLALASIYQYLIKNKALSRAILLLFLTTAGHLGIGYLLFASCLVIIFEGLSWPLIKQRLPRLFRIVALSVFFLAYWLIPFGKEADYHAVSFWDPVWKWNSFGYQHSFNLLLSGELLDFGRPVPLFSLFLAIGFFAALARKSAFAFLFGFWFLVFWGRATWGSLLDLVPGMKEFHQHRFLVGAHLAALFLAPMGFLQTWSWFKTKLELTLKKLKRAELLTFKKPALVSLSLLLLMAGWVFFSLYRGVWQYAYYNTIWLREANKEFAEQKADWQAMLGYLKQAPAGRIYALNSFEGEEFQVGETPVHMELSVSDFAINGFLPETWSPNSDNEFFFNNQKDKHYNLYNIRFLVAPAGFKAPEFAQLVKGFGKFYLYEVETNGYFDLVSTNLLVRSEKTDFVNIVHLWQNSDLISRKVHPLLTFKDAPAPFPGLTKIKMVNEVEYQTNDQILSLFGTNPLPPDGSMVSGRLLAANNFSATIEVEPDCQNCLLIFKTTYHPNWQVFLDDQKVKEKLMVFPAFLAIKVPEGQHQVRFVYQPSPLKTFLLALTLIFLIALTTRLGYIKMVQKQ